MATVHAIPERNDATGLPGRSKRLIMAGVLLGLFLEATDQTIVATALPAIVSEFQGLGLIGWVTTGYLLASTALVPIYGRLSDRYGRRAIVLWSISVFLLGSVLCGLAGTMLQLVIFRVVQGVGAAGLASTAFAVPADLYPPAERAHATALIGMTFGLASVIGPFLGGVLTDALGWRWIFFVNLPVGLLALGFILLKMPALAGGRRQPLDWWGTALLLATVVPLLLALSLDKAIHPWTSPLVLGLLTLTVVAGGALIRVERRAVAPIIPLGLFANRTFALAVAIASVLGAAFLATVLFLSLFLVNVVGTSASVAGTALVPFTLGVMVSGMAGAAVAQRTGRYKPVMLAGLGVLLVGFGLLAMMSAAVSLWDVVWRVCLVGLGAGALAPLLQLAAQNAVPFAEVGAATASVQFFQQIGSMLGTTVASAVLAALLTSQLTTTVSPIVAQFPPSAREAIDVATLRNGASTVEGAAVERVDLADQAAAGVAESYQELRERLAVAGEAGDPAALAELAADPSAPRELSTALRASADEASLRLDDALAALDAAERTALVEARSLGMQAQAALQQAFAFSVTRLYLGALALAVVALILTLALPELPLRTSNAASAATAGH